MIVQTLRLLQAARLLLLTEEPITEIGREVGYESLQSFDKAFAALFEMKPSTFRVFNKHNPDVVPTLVRDPSGRLLLVPTVSPVVINASCNVMTIIFDRMTPTEKQYPDGSIRSCK